MKPLIIVGAVLAAAIAWAPTFAQPAQTPDDVKLALARQIYELSGGTQAARDHLKATFDAADKIVAENLPPDRAKLTQVMEQDMMSELSDLVPSLIDSGAHAYADHLTEQELRDYAAWLSSDSGKSLLRKLPAIREEMVEREMPALSGLFRGLSGKLLNRVCAEAHCTAQDREVIAAALAKALPAGKS